MPRIYRLMATMVCTVALSAQAQTQVYKGCAPNVGPHAGMTGGAASLTYQHGGHDTPVPVLHLQINVAPADRGLTGGTAFFIQESTTGARMAVTPSGAGNLGRLVQGSADSPMPFWSRGPLPETVQARLVLGDALTQACAQNPAAIFEVYAGYGVLTQEARKGIEARLRSAAARPDLTVIDDPRLRAEAQAALARAQQSDAKVRTAAQQRLEEDHAIYINALERGTCWQVLRYACAPQSSRRTPEF